eukprot:gene41935-40933_t
MPTSPVTPMSPLPQADIAGAKSFAELKGDLFFNEKRLGLLLKETLHGDMEQWLKEKDHARSDCRGGRLDHSVAGKMRGVWNEVKVVQAFDVEVGLRLGEERGGRATPAFAPGPAALGAAAALSPSAAPPPPPVAGPSRSGRPRPYLRLCATPRAANDEAAPPPPPVAGPSRSGRPRAGVATALRAASSPRRWRRCAAAGCADDGLVLRRRGGARRGGWGDGDGAAAAESAVAALLAARRRWRNPPPAAAVQLSKERGKRAAEGEGRRRRRRRVRRRAAPPRGSVRGGGTPPAAASGDCGGSDGARASSLRPVATTETAALIERIRELGSLLPAPIPHTVVWRFDDVDWDRRDVARHGGGAKETLLREIGELTRCLQEIGWSCSLQTIESSQSENAIKRRNNVSQWKLAAAQLETLKEQKLDRQRECIRDKGRIDRGVEYETRKHEGMRADFRDRRRGSDERLDALGKRQEELQRELHALALQFREVEGKLADLAAERIEAVTARVEVVEEEAQRVADFQEFLRFSNEHRGYVGETQAASERAARFINQLQRFLMNEQDYDEHDFHQTTRLLSELKVKALTELNQCYNDYHLGLMRQARQMESQIKKAEEEASRQQLLAEVSKETLNPEAKRHALMKDKSAIFRKLDFIRSNYLRKVKEELPADKVIELDDDIEWETLKKRDDHLDMREELIYPVEYQILDEREDIRDDEVNRQCKKGQGKVALALRREVAGAPVDAEPDPGDGPADLAVAAAEQHQKAQLEEAERQQAQRKETRPVAA